MAATAAAATGEHEWLWQALREGQRDLVMRLAPRSFDWKSLHPAFGTPLMATVHKAVMFKGGEEEEARIHELIRWCMTMGADPRTVAPEADALSVGLPPRPPGKGWTKLSDTGKIWWFYGGDLGRFWCNDNSKNEMQIYLHADRTVQAEVKFEAEHHSMHSAISLTIAIKRKLDPCGAEYGVFRGRIDRLLSVFADAGQPQTESIMEGLVSTWAAVLGDTGRADVELRLPDGAGMVRAHALLLCNASPVLKAALTSCMKEGKTMVVDVPGVTEPALRHLLSLIYTGCPEQDTVLAEVHLQALDLAHRWQVDHTVAALEIELAKQVDIEMVLCPEEEQVRLLDEVLEAAVLKRLSHLRATCHKLVDEMAPLKEALRSGGFGRIAAQDLGHRAPSKRRRTLELS